MRYALVLVVVFAAFGSGFLVGADRPSKAVEIIMADLADEQKMVKPMQEMLDNLPPELKRLLPEGFNQKFVELFKKEGIPEVRSFLIEHLDKDFTEDELSYWAVSMKKMQHDQPELKGKIEKLMLDLMKHSQEIGKNISKKVAR